MKKWWAFARRQSDPDNRRPAQDQNSSRRPRRSSEPVRPSLTSRPPTSLEISREKGLDHSWPHLSNDVSQLTMPGHARGSYEDGWAASVHVPMSVGDLDVADVDANMTTDTSKKNSMNNTGRLAVDVELVERPSLYGPRGSLTVRTPRGSVGAIAPDHVNAFRSLPPSPSLSRREGAATSQADILSVGRPAKNQPMPSGTVEPEPEWKRLLGNVFRPPRVLHDWTYDLREVEVKAGWTELFYDLLFVAVCIILGNQLKNNLTWEGLGVTFVYFAAFYWSWGMTNYYFSRFVVDDIVHQGLLFVHMAGILCMAVSVGEGGLLDGLTAYAIGLVISRLPLIIIHLLVAWSVLLYIPRARRGSLVIVFSSLIATGLWIGSIFVPEGVAIGLWCTGLVVEVIALCLPGIHIKPHGGYISERHGLFVMLVLGESIIALTVRHEDYELTGSYIMVVMLGFSVVFNLQLNFFDTLPKDHNQDKLANNSARMRAIALVHLFLGFALLCTGVGLKVAVLDSAGSLERKEKALLGCSIAIAQLIAQLLRALHHAGYDDRAYFATTERKLVFIVRLGIPLATLAVAIFAELDTTDYILVLWAETMVYLIIDTWSHERYALEMKAVLVQEHMTWEGLDYVFEPCPDLDAFYTWEPIDVRLWMKNDLKLSEDSMDKVVQHDISGEKLLQASAAEIIVVFGSNDGARLVLELARVVSGANTLHRTDSRTSMGRS